jgi:hypothetical protein
LPRARGADTSADELDVDVHHRLVASHVFCVYRRRLAARLVGSEQPPLGDEGGLTKLFLGKEVPLFVLRSPRVPPGSQNLSQTLSTKNKTDF